MGSGADADSCCCSRCTCKTRAKPRRNLHRSTPNAYVDHPRVLGGPCHPSSGRVFLVFGTIRFLPTNTQRREVGRGYTRKSLLVQLTNGEVIFVHQLTACIECELLHVTLQAPGTRRGVKTNHHLNGVFGACGIASPASFSAELQRVGTADIQL
jgi:hypothetical protein